MPIDICVDYSRVQRRSKQRATRRVRGDRLAIGKYNIHAGSEPPVQVENRESSVFARDQFAGKQEGARSGRRGRLLSGGKLDAQEEETQAQNGTPEATGEGAHRGIVVEISTAKKGDA